MATSYLSPGVYVEEVDRGSKPIEAVGTTSASSVSTSDDGPGGEIAFDQLDSVYLRPLVTLPGRHSSPTRSTDFSTTAALAAIVNVGAPASLDLSPADKAAAADKAAMTVTPTAPGGTTPSTCPRLTPTPTTSAGHGPGARTGLKCFEGDRDGSRSSPLPARSRWRMMSFTHCEVRKGSLLRHPSTAVRPFRAAWIAWCGRADSMARSASRGSRSTIRERGNVFIPPSGHCAGVYARTDNEHGVQGPANEDRPRRAGPALQVSRGEQDILNPRGINCIRLAQGRRHPHLGPAPCRAIRRGATSTSAACSSW